MKLKVKGDLVFVKPAEQPKYSDSGLELIYNRQHSTMRGTVIALGEGPRSRNGTLLPHLVKLHDHVIFSPDAGQELHFEKEVVMCLPEDEILAVIS